MRVVFSFIIGNSDMHLKNFSLREIEPASRIFRLSDAYDMLPVNIIMPEDTEQLALTLNGKKRNIHKKDFYLFAEKCGISKKTLGYPRVNIWIFIEFLCRQGRGIISYSHTGPKTFRKI